MYLTDWIIYIQQLVLSNAINNFEELSDAVWIQVHIAVRNIVRSKGCFPRPLAKVFRPGRKKFQFIFMPIQENRSLQQIECSCPWHAQDWKHSWFRWVLALWIFGLRLHGFQNLETNFLFFAQWLQKKSEQDKLRSRSSQAQAFLQLRMISKRRTWKRSKTKHIRSWWAKFQRRFKTSSDYCRQDCGGDGKVNEGGK